MPMDREATLGRAVELAAAVDTLAALAAYIRLETEDLPADPQVHDLLGRIAATVTGSDPSSGDGAAHGPSGSAELAPVVGLARTVFRLGAELVDNPGRSGSWDQVDPPLLQSMGRLSMGISDAVRAAEDRLESLADALARPGARLLDVGTGTGWLAIALARSHPTLSVVGLDRFEPALRLAEQNVASEGLTDRVTLQLDDATTLDAPASYDAVWLPMPFLPKEIVPAVIATAVTNLKPGGWLLPGTFTGPMDPLSELLTDLRTVRSGGYPWRGEELLDALRAAGLNEATEVPRTWSAPVRLYAARRTG
jgi:SAM-dependent methyltransferase